jgi:putative cell wall-binding protein
VTIEIGNQVEAVPHYILDIPNAVAFSTSESNNFIAEDGLLYNKTKKVLFRCPRRYEGPIELPETLKTISEAAFYRCNSIQTLTIPAKVETLDNRAFSECKNLGKVFFTGNKPAFGDDVFYEVTCNGYYPFSNQTWETLPSLGYHNNVTWIPVSQGTVQKITLVQEPDVVLYEKDADVDLSGLRFEVTFSDGLVWTYTEAEIQRVECDFSEIGKREVKAYYNGFPFTFIVTVYEIIEIEISSSEYPESDHPYEDGLDKTYTYKYPGAYKLELTFSENSCLEYMSDYLYILDSQGNQIGKYTGSELAGKTIEVQDEKTVIRLVTDEDGTDYGFSLDRIVAYYREGGCDGHHIWGEPFIEWADDLKSAKDIRICIRDSDHEDSVTATVESIVTKEPTAMEDGICTYKATAEFSDGTKATDMKTAVIPAWGWKWRRLAGSSRYNTMKAITQEAYPDSENGKLKTLIVATAESFPDALSGAALAGIYNCPIILTATSKLSVQARDEIQRLAAPDCKVIILGGTGAVYQEVEDSIKALGYTVERVAGSSRLKTAMEVYKKGASEANGFADNDTVIITTGFNYADVLSISPYAYASKTPILLTDKNGLLVSDVKKLISDAGFRKAIIVGGTGAVSEATESYLKGQGLTVLRLSGSNRYVTSAQIMKWGMGLLEDAPIQPSIRMTNSGMGVASGENFPDALASVSLLGKTRSVLMLVSNTKSRATIQKNIDELIKPYAKEMGKGYIFGGTGALTQEIEDLLNAAIK